MSSLAEPSSEVGVASHSGDEAVLLGAASDFAVLGGQAVTNTGPSVINGDVGVSPGSSITGFFPPGVVNGTIYKTTPEAAAAQSALTTAINDAAGRPCGDNLTGSDLGTVGILSAGVYCYDSAALLTGTLVLSGGADDVFIFQIPTQLTTAPNSSVSLIGGAQACNIFWQVGSLAALDTNTKFVGTILAGASVTMNTGATLEGRALASTGNVTLDTNTITRPSCAAGEDDDGGGGGGGDEEGGEDSSEGEGDDGGDDGSSGGTTPPDDDTNEAGDNGDDTPGGTGGASPDGTIAAGDVPAATLSAGAPNESGSPLRLASSPVGTTTEASDMFAAASAAGDTTAAGTTAGGSKANGGFSVASGGAAELPRTGSSVPVEQTLVLGLGLLLVGMFLTSIANARIRVSPLSRKVVTLSTTSSSREFVAGARVARRRRRPASRLNMRI